MASVLLVALVLIAAGALWPSWPLIIVGAILIGLVPVGLIIPVVRAPTSRGPDRSFVADVAERIGKKKGP